MRITAVYSSPRKNSNSSDMADSFIEAVGKAEVDKFYLSNMKIKGCMGCGKCRTNDLKRCVRDDGMKEIYKSIDMSDILIFASPMYWWSISSQLKTVIDRLYPYIGTGRLDGKKLVLLVSGFSDLENSGYKLIDEMFKEICAYINLDYYSYFVSADDERPVMGNIKALEGIKAMTKKIII